MGINLNKGSIIGAFSGLIVFIIALVFIINVSGDFDQRLIEQVDSGVPADELIPQIDRETKEMNIKAEKRLSNVINKKLDKNDAMSYQSFYEAEIKIISQYANIRKKFARREINKEEFLKEIETPKYAMNQLYKH